MHCTENTARIARIMNATEYFHANPEIEDKYLVLRRAKMSLQELGG